MRFGKHRAPGCCCEVRFTCGACLEAAVARNLADRNATPGFREDFKTGQFFPTVNGVDVSPSAFSAERALQIAKEVILGGAQ